MQGRRIREQSGDRAGWILTESGASPCARLGGARAFCPVRLGPASLSCAGGRQLRVRSRPIPNPALGDEQTLEPSEFASNGLRQEPCPSLTGLVQVLIVDRTRIEGNVY